MQSNRKTVAKALLWPGDTHLNLDTADLSDLHGEVCITAPEPRASPESLRAQPPGCGRSLRGVDYHRAAGAGAKADPQHFADGRHRASACAGDAEGAHWSAAQRDAWTLLALLPLTIALATPKGLLRLFDRFDLLARHVAVTPLARLVGALVLMALDADLLGWIVMWVAAGAAGLAVGLWLGFREAHRRGLLAGMDLSVRGLGKGNNGLVGFAMISNIHSSLLLLPGHVATFSVGMVLGAQSAGLMKVAQELGSGLAKPIDLINQSAYPDITRLAARHGWQRVRTLVTRAGATAMGISALVTLLLLVAGELVIRLVFGAEFEDARTLLILISVATILTVSVFAVEPTLYAIGKPSRPLVTAALANAVLIAVMFAAFEPLGLLAPGFAWIATAAATVVAGLFWMTSVVPKGRA